MTKDKLEDILNRSSIKPVHRTHVIGREIFIADGFITPSMLQFLKVFNVDATPEEFPFGGFATLWYSEAFTGGECGCKLFDAFHDKGHSLEAKLQIRIQNIILEAARDLEAGRKRSMH
jgi:hypothetical protein